jgi:cytochrome b561
MAFRNTPERWGWVTQGLHWLMVILIVGNVVLGKVATGMGLSPDKLKVFIWHKSIGLTVLGLALLRLAWRWLGRTPDSNPDQPRWERLAAAASHFMMYVMMLAMPLSGWALNSAANVPLRWFYLIPVASLVPPDEDWKEIFELLHEWLFVVFAALVVVHAIAALKHHFINRDDILRRMWPFASRR